MYLSRSVAFCPVLQGMRGDSYMEADSDSEVEERSEGQKTMLKLDDWVGFRVDTDAAHLALQLRQKWHALFIRRMRAPSKTWSQVGTLGGWLCLIGS